MTTKNLLSELQKYVEQNIPEFHRRRLDSLNGLKLRDVLKRKNPYLFKARHLIGAEDLVKSLLDAHLSSQEETVFGEFLEQVAIFVCETVLHGRKSEIVGIDLEFEKEGILYLISIKSGPNWGNKSQIDKLKDYFRKAKLTLKTNAKAKLVVCVNGCCYGRQYSDNGDYLKLCGERFWTLISNEPRLYIDLIQPLGFEAKKRNEDFELAYAKVRTKFTIEFVADFCDEFYAVDWEKLIVFNSSKRGN